MTSDNNVTSIFGGLAAAKVHTRIWRNRLHTARQKNYIHSEQPSCHGRPHLISSSLSKGVKAIDTRMRRQ